MQHLARFHDDIREPPLESSSSSTSSPASSSSDRLAAADDGLMRFWVLKFYASSSASQAVERVLEIGVLDGSFRVVNPHKQTHKALSIRHISQLGSSLCLFPRDSSELCFSFCPLDFVY